jgi:hypothetical protein
METLDALITIFLVCLTIYNCFNIYKHVKRIFKLKKVQSKVEKLFEREKSLHQLRRILRKLAVYEPDINLTVIEHSIIDTKYKAQRQVLYDELDKL